VAALLHTLWSQDDQYVILYYVPEAAPAVPPEREETASKWRGRLGSGASAGREPRTANLCPGTLRISSVSLLLC
jgi:hypothetical protein